jgi:hypothetical protein
LKTAKDRQEQPLIINPRTLADDGLRILTRRASGCRSRSRSRCCSPSRLAAQLERQTLRWHRKGKRSPTLGRVTPKAARRGERASFRDGSFVAPREIIGPRPPRARDQESHNCGGKGGCGAISWCRGPMARRRRGVSTRSSAPQIAPPRPHTPRPQQLSPPGPRIRTRTRKFAIRFLAPRT